ncbi:N-acetylmuramoyl-L-alanine amidase-like [Oncorhynchus masou masou]|uniref:N-acetylmuramoyl-L-alanine amidase-like n=1 Tax=Oncorhynchus masou masou TaxID=90313 RepID=UPI0031834C85
MSSKSVLGCIRRHFKGGSTTQRRVPSHHPTVSLGGRNPTEGLLPSLALPIPFLYIHHTFEPDRPCHSFKQFSRSMRAMQRFHQEDRGWADVPLSFVVGSEGYIYEGRGWHHLGNHTRGQNPYGYGVAFIGNYSSFLPSRHALDLVRQHLAKCAVDGGRLQANFTLHGHRQLVDTSCPGDALYSEIRGWEHFGVRDCSVL